MSAHERRITAPDAGRRRSLVVLGVLLLGVPGIVGFQAAFGTPRALVAGAVGLVLGVLVGWASALRRLSAVTTAAMTVLVCALAAGPAALPATTIAGAVPTLETFRQLASGVIRSWRNLLTATAPTGPLGNLLLVPYLTGLLAGVLGVVVALRSGRPVWALLPPGAVLLVSVLMGTAEPVSPLLQGGLFAVLAVGWVAATSQSWARPNLARAAAGLALLAVAATAAAFLGPAVTQLVDDRFVLRNEVDPPFDIRAYASPLNGFRKFVKDEGGTPLFTVMGAPEGSQIRLATMDAFDGAVWNVAGGTAGDAASSGSFRRMPLDTGDTDLAAGDGRAALRDLHRPPSRPADGELPLQQRHRDGHRPRRAARGRRLPLPRGRARATDRRGDGRPGRRGAGPAGAPGRAPGDHVGSRRRGGGRPGRLCPGHSHRPRLARDGLLQQRAR
jgi:hypothetical protein